MKKNFLRKNKNTTNYLDELIKLSKNDSQISIAGKFDDFTDFQNIMLSNFCLLELLWEGHEGELEQKNIRQLFLECLELEEHDSLDYKKTILTGSHWLKMADKKNWKKYRILVLKKLISYGFSEITIKKRISGNNGFDAFLLEDSCKNLMVYYPCTNLVELDDFIYDSYNIINGISKNKKEFINKIIPLQKNYLSQQLQAKEFLEDSIKLLPKGKTLNVFGFSLGASLAEASYLNSYDNFNQILGNLILFNPYHNNLTQAESNKLKETDKLKIYACEGDMVSTVFNYNEFSDITKPIYINYLENSKIALQNIDRDKNLLNSVINYIKNNLCDTAINSINQTKVRCSKYNFILKVNLNFKIWLINRIKKIRINAVRGLKSFSKIVSFLQKLGSKFNVDNDFEFLKNIHYVEYIFTIPHLPYLVEIYKEISFDKKGNILNIINNNGEIYNVDYPSFNDTSTKIFGTNIYDDLINIITKIHKK